jgi:hypothetical protein
MTSLLVSLGAQKSLNSTTRVLVIHKGEISPLRETRRTEKTRLFRTRIKGKLDYQDIPSNSEGNRYIGNDDL